MPLLKNHNTVVVTYIDTYILYLHKSQPEHTSRRPRIAVSVVGSDIRNLFYLTCLTQSRHKSVLCATALYINLRALALGSPFAVQYGGGGVRVRGARTDYLPTYIHI